MPKMGKDVCCHTGTRMAENYEERRQEKALIEYVQPSPTKYTSWELKDVPFDGIPFQTVGTEIFGCHQGRDKNVHEKEKLRAQKQQQSLNDHSFDKRRRLLQNTKKLDCPAKFIVHHLMKFPDFKIADNNSSKRRQASAALKKAIAGDETVHVNIEYHVRFPSTDEHLYHPVVGEAAGLREPIDPRVQKQISKLTLAGARKVVEVKRHLETFVNDELFRGEQPPPQTRRRFFPTDEDIRNIMGRTKASTRESKSDQANLQPKLLSLRSSE
ncbi:hypothetical protein Bbelb_153690 [Branchiostoma belcheri]|nr:hypothetical protein Bbelb_153690 [Branchiostoma belcheri]